MGRRPPCSCACPGGGADLDGYPCNNLGPSIKGLTYSCRVFFLYIRGRLPRGEALCEQSHSRQKVQWQAAQAGPRPHLQKALCSAAAILKFLIVFDQRPCIFTVCWAMLIMQPVLPASSRHPELQGLLWLGRVPRAPHCLGPEGAAVTPHRTQGQQGACIPCGVDVE